MDAGRGGYQSIHRRHRSSATFALGNQATPGIGDRRIYRKDSRFEAIRQILQQPGIKQLPPLPGSEPLNSAP